MGGKALDSSNKIGAGFFCETYKGIWNGTIQVAIRTPIPGFPVSRFREEAAIIKQLSHPNIIQLYGTCLNKEPLYILTEFMTLGTLYEYLYNEKKFLAAKFPKVVYDIAAQVARGMAHMEEQKCIHRNLSSQTILVGDNLICKVANFSCAKKINPGCEIYRAPDSEEFKAPVRWSAPEAFLGRNFSSKSDVWSFGILLYEITTYGQIPYPELPDAAIIKQLEDDVEGLQMPRPPACPTAVYEIMADCRKADPSKRPSFKELLKHMEDY